METYKEVNVYYKPTSYLYRDAAIVALGFAMVFLTIHTLEDFSGALLWQCVLGIIGLVLRYIEHSRYSKRLAFSIQKQGIRNLWGTYHWEQIRNMQIEKGELVFEAHTNAGPPKAFRYKTEGLDVETHYLQSLVTAHQQQYENIRHS